MSKGNVTTQVGTERQRHRGTKSKKLTTGATCGLRRELSRAVEPSGVSFDRDFLHLNENW